MQPAALHHGPHEQTADVISVEPSTVCALLTVPNLLDLNATHPFLVFKIICHAGETLVSYLSRQLKQLKAAGGGAPGAGAGAASGGSKSPKSSPKSPQHKHKHPTFLRKVVGKWREQQMEYLLPSVVDEDTMARLQAVTGGGGGGGGDDASPSGVGTNDSPKGQGTPRRGGGSREGKRGGKGAGNKKNKKMQTGEALFDHYTGEFEFDAAAVESGDNRLHPLLGGRTPAELLHDVISFSPVFRGEAVRFRV
jgi:hypothetical protein